METYEEEGEAGMQQEDHDDIQEEVEALHTSHGMNHHTEDKQDRSHPHMIQEVVAYILLGPAFRSVGRF
jgi:hypothetical protein